MNYDVIMRDKVEKIIVSTSLAYSISKEIKEAFYNGEIKEEYFKNPLMREVVSVMKTLYDQGKTPTVELVVTRRSDKYRDNFSKESVSDSERDYFIDMTNLITHAQNVVVFQENLHLLKEFCLIDYWNNVSNDIRNGYWNNRDLYTVSENIVEGYKERVEELFKSNLETDESDDIDSIIKKTIEQYKLKQSGEDKTVRFGHNLMDDHSGGLVEAEFTIVGGRPGMGKTALGLSIAKYNSIYRGIKGVFFTLEMTKQQLINKYAVSVLDIPYTRIKSLNLTIEELHRLEQFYRWFDEHSNIDIYFISDLDQIVSIVENGDYKYCVIDYIQLITTKQSFSNRELQISHISRTLKGLAKKALIPVIGLAQLKRIDGKPKLSDLRESGALEQDADNVLFPYRQAYYVQDAPNYLQGNIEFILAKCRSSGAKDFMGNLDLVKFEIFERVANSEEDLKDILSSSIYQ